MKLGVRTVRLKLRAPLRTAWGELHERELLHVTLDGGEGEAAPLEPYDGVSLASVRAALDAYAEVLRDDPEDPLAACRAERDLPQALAAVDLALWDLRSRRAGVPISRLLAAEPLREIPVNATIGAEDRAGAAAQAAAALERGFTTLKVKVGIGDDAGRLAAIRAVAPHAALRADANGAWRTPREALANLRALAPLDLELCEEPIHGVDALRAVREESPVPIAMDETYAPGSGAADFVCLKITRGGITQVLQDARSAREAGSEVYLASTFDGPLGIAAALHAAAALGVKRPCGLATLGLFDAVEHVEPRNGTLIVPLL